MSQTFRCSIKSSFFDRERQLTIAPGYFEFDDNDLAGTPATRFLKEDIEAFRYGVKMLRGYAFYIGRTYCVDIKSNNGAIVKIRLRSMYGVRKKKLYTKWHAIITALYNNFFEEMSGSYLGFFNLKQSFEILGVIFNQEGIWLDAKSKFIPWEDVGTRSYFTYYAIYSKSNPEIYKAFEYLDDWNTGILYSVSRQVLLIKNLVDS